MPDISIWTSCGGTLGNRKPFCIVAYLLVSLLRRFGWMSGRMDAAAKKTSVPRHFPQQMGNQLFEAHRWHL